MTIHQAYLVTFTIRTRCSEKHKLFAPGQNYTAFSRVKTYYNLYCIGEFRKSAIKVNKDALVNYECLK